MYQKIKLLGKTWTYYSILLFTTLLVTACGPFHYTGNMNTPRVGHTATLLKNGKVLIAGGFGIINGSVQSLASAELYDPAHGTFKYTGFHVVRPFNIRGPGMNMPRSGHTATRLNDGKVLIAGGFGVISDPASAELYDPTTGIFTYIGSMNMLRRGHTATRLNDGKVLIAGGEGIISGSVQPLASAELYDPTTGTFSPTGSMSTGRIGHTATLLNDGKVLITGLGSSGELYDPATSKFSPIGSMSTGRDYHTATRLNDGKVLIAGSYGGSDPASAELYDPTAGTFSPTGSMSTGRNSHTDTLLNNGRVLIAGGYDTSFQPLASAELYDPTTDTFISTGSLNMNTPRVGHTATRLNDGKVLITGGYGAYFQYLASAELFGDP